MSRLTNRSVASVIVAVALVAAGCGSSSKSKTTPPAAPGATTPATPSTPSTPSTGTTTTGGKVSPTAAITSPQFKALLVSQAEKNGAPASKAPQFSDCVIAKLSAEGVKTAQDFKNNTTKGKAAVLACNKSVGVNVKP